MNAFFTMLDLVMIASSETDSSRTIGAVMASAGLNDILRGHNNSEGA